MNNLVSRIKGIFLILLILPLSVAAQTEDEDNDEDKDRSFSIEAGTIIGGQVFNDNFIYSPGWHLATVYGFKSGKRTILGVGAGAQLFEEERFFPLFLSFQGDLKNKQNTTFFTFRGGYSFGDSEKYEHLSDYEFRGGPYVNIGLGRKFSFQENYSFFIHLAYQHQFASVSYTSRYMEDYFERLNYDMLLISVGVVFE